MARRYFSSPLPPPGPATLGTRHGHHLGRIARVKPGDPVVLFDGAGHEVQATILEVRGREVVVEVGAAVTQLLGRAPRMALEVAVALPRRPRADWLFEHGTEVGVSSFRPIITERTNRHHDDHDRWRRVLVAACTQCDRSVLPTIEPTVTLDELCAMPRPEQSFVATYTEQELGPATDAHALLVIGPEGGLAPREIEQLVATGFAPRSLGPLTLRTETAVLAGATRLLQDL